MEKRFDDTGGAVHGDGEEGSGAAWIIPEGFATGPGLTRFQRSGSEGGKIAGGKRITLVGPGELKRYNAGFDPVTLQIESRVCPAYQGRALSRCGLIWQVNDGVLRNGILSRQILRSGLEDGETQAAQ